MRAAISIVALIHLALAWVPTRAIAEAPPLTLSKTVGTDPNACGLANEITVTAGTDVTYCYRIQNDSGITLTSHDLFDDHLGDILVGFPYQLSSGGSAFLTQTTTILATTTNVATWTASNTSIIITKTADTADAAGTGQGWNPSPVITFAASDDCTVNVGMPETETDAGPDGCSDGIDNDQDGTVDCGDVDCVGVGPCAAPAPLLGPGGMLIAGLLLVSIGARSLLLRSRNR